jgi:hypothetical protein
VAVSTGLRWRIRRPAQATVNAISTIMLLRAIEAMYPAKRLIHLFVVRQAKLARSSR